MNPNLHIPKKKSASTSGQCNHIKRMSQWRFERLPIVLFKCSKKVFKFLLNFKYDFV